MIDLLSTADVAISIDSYPQHRGATVRNRRQAESHELAQWPRREGGRRQSTNAKLRAMSFLNGRGAKEEDKVKPT